MNYKIPNLKEVLKDIEASFAELEQIADDIVEDVAINIAKEERDTVRVLTGELRNSIRQRKVGKLHREVNGRMLNYGAYLEYGTVHARAFPFVRPSVQKVSLTINRSIGKCIKRWRRK